MTSAHLQIKVRQHLLLPERNGKISYRQRIFRRLGSITELKPRRLLVGQWAVHHVHALQHLFTRFCHVGGACAHLVASNIVFEFFYFLLLAVVLLLLQFDTLAFQLLVLGVIALVRSYFFVLYVPNGSTKLVQKISVMGHHDQRGLFVGKEVFQPIQRFVVKVVCRFVQYQQFGTKEKQLTQCGFGFLSTAKGTYHSVGKLSHAHTAKHGFHLLLRHVGFRHVGLHRQFVVTFRQPQVLLRSVVERCHLVGNSLYLLHKFVLLGKHAQQLGKQSVVGNKIAVLLQHTDCQAVFLVYVSAKQLFFARDTGQQRAFTCAVCTDQTYVVALVHVQIDIGKYDCISVTKLRRRYLQ